MADHCRASIHQEEKRREAIMERMHPPQSLVAAAKLLLAAALCIVSYADDVQDVCKTAPPPGSYSPQPHDAIPKEDVDFLLHALNLEYLEAELFLYGGYGQGLDHFARDIAAGGPSPRGAQQANLEEDPFVQDITQQFGLQEIGHLRAIKETIPEAFPRPQLDLSKDVFAKIMDKALGQQLQPPFDPYADSTKFLLAMYMAPYVGLTGYVGSTRNLTSPTAKRLVGGLLAVESGQDAVIRALLYARSEEKVRPYDISVGEVTQQLSELRNELGKSGKVDEGLWVARCLGAQGRTEGNVLAGDRYSLGFARTPEQILGVVYGTGDPASPGGFFPEGAKGAFAERHQSHLKQVA